MVGFYGELLPMTGPVLADPELIAWLRDDGPAKAQKEAAAKARGRAGGGQDDAAAPPGGPPAGHPGGAAAGPVMGHTALIGYLDAERRAGRLASGAPLPYIAAALLGGCQQHAFLTRLAGPEAVAAGAGLPARRGGVRGAARPDGPGGPHRHLVTECGHKELMPH
ncbi:hypothetical protein [Actinomadura madurae]|uniref:hypothetical protein n=1 Tax=Actinomadura madurae TaxID=1993 RepID=UPI0020D1F638|nr:hypothetical protein [Actinomadura madurae]MCQ0018816.1 hypothetical protein [Actinomadura madurae]